MTEQYHIHEIRDAIFAAERDSTKEKKVVAELERIIGQEFSGTSEALVRLTISVYQRFFYDEFLKILEGMR